jgi:hypothetical protein
MIPDSMVDGHVLDVYFLIDKRRKISCNFFKKKYIHCHPFDRVPHRQYASKNARNTTIRKPCSRAIQRHQKNHCHSINPCTIGSSKSTTTITTIFTNSKISLPPVQPTATPPIHIVSHRNQCHSKALLFLSPTPPKNHCHSPYSCTFGKSKLMTTLTAWMSIPRVKRSDDTRLRHDPRP